MWDESHILASDILNRNINEADMGNIQNELRVIAQLMECDTLDESSKEFIQVTVTKAANELAKPKTTKLSSTVCYIDKAHYAAS